MASTPQCDNFVGNAWKKDLCLNCFKSKEEHQIKNGDVIKIPTKLPDPPKEGILKGTKCLSQTAKANKVLFHNNEFEVIGFGGDDVYSDEDDYPDAPINGSTDDDDDYDNEEDRAFQKLTKTNTDYNSVPENLQEPKNGEVKKLIEPLKLGKQLLDDKGNKKTLLVTVTPFGGQNLTVKNKINVNSSKVNVPSIKETKTDVESCEEVEKPRASIVENGSRTVEEVKPADEKTEIVQNIKITESVNSETEVQKYSKPVEIAQINIEDASTKTTNDKSIKRSQPLDKNSKIRLNKDLLRENEKNTNEMNGNTQEDDKNRNKNNEKLTTAERVTNLIDKAKKKVNHLPVLADAPNIKFKTKDFSNKKSSITIPEKKPVLLDIYQLKNNEEVKTNNEKNEEKTMKSIILSPEMRNKFLSSELKINSSMLEVTEKKIEVKPVTERTKLVPNVSSLYRQYNKNVSKVEEVENKAPEEDPAKVEENLSTSISIVPNIVCKFNDDLKANSKKPQKKIEAFVPNTIILTDNLSEVTENNNCSTTETCAQNESSFTSFESYENFERMIKGEEITLFSAEKSRQEDCTDSIVDEKIEVKQEEKLPELTRESAGEPDGKADSDDLSEPPALPTKPPPTMDPRATFLHDLASGGECVKVYGEKPKVPAKPIIIQSKKTNFQSPVHTKRPKSPSMEKFLDITSSPQVVIKTHPPLQEMASTDSVKSQKRPAPKPPSPKEEPEERIARKSSEEAESDESCPKILEKENLVVKEREPIRRISRSTENLLELMSDSQEKNGDATGSEEVVAPEPVPRRSLSLSQDSLLSSGIGDVQAKKKSSRGRFSLRKLLHLGKNKDSKDLATRQRNTLPPAPKPKLEIIHPNDLNGARVEVVPPLRTSKSRRTSSSASSSSGEQRESDVLSDSSTSHSVSSSGNDSHTTIEKSKRPPPPPRAQSLDTWSNKPARPPPPKAIDVLRQSNTTTWTPTTESKQDNVYVNLGEARSGLAPNKPVRTGSLREANMENGKRLVAVSSQPEDSGYESFDVSLSTIQSMESNLHNDDNVYECVQVSQQRSSSPECDSVIPDSPNPSYTKMKRCVNARNHNHRRSDGSVDLSPDYFKMKFMRSVSLPYCASETESEIYSPYSFYGGSELGEDDYEWSPTSGRMLRSSRLKLKKGRSIVHKNLEDNYGAVIVANHEALSQFVEQMRQGPIAPPALRSLTTAANLRWSDFSISKDTPGVVVERRIFYPALWGIHPVTLSLMAEQGLNSSLHAKGPFNLNPLTELNDLVPSFFLPMMKKDDSELIQASISVLTRLQIETIETYGKTLSTGAISDETKKEINFILLQIINALKCLQAQGIEEAPVNLTNLIVCREERDPHPRVCITHSFERSDDSSKGSLCQCVINALTDVLPPTDLTSLITDVLRKEKAVSLSQAKAILEFTLWGPADIAFGNSTRERESALQRWLDLERATVLQGLVRTRAELTVFEEWHLLFLVRTNAKMMAEASLLLETGNMVGSVGSS